MAKDPFDTRRSYIPTPNKVQPNKPQKPAPEDLQPQGSKYSEDNGTDSETSLIRGAIVKGVIT